MPPTRRLLKALGSLQLVGYANNPTRVITELAFIADKRVNVLPEGSQSDLNAPIEVQFEEFMDGVNTRGKGTRAKQRKMTVEQAAAVLLLSVQKGHVELITKRNDPHTIDVIRVLPEAKRILAAFLPKLRGYGDIPYDVQYRGAIALAKRHFFPKGKPPTKKELMTLLLQSYQERRELAVKCQSKPRSTKTLSIQTSCQTIDASSCPRPASCESAQSPCTVNTFEIPTQSDSGSGLEFENSTMIEPMSPSPINSQDHDLISGSAPEPVERTPVAPRSFNPYMTPISNPRHVDHSLLDESPTPAINNRAEIPSDEDNLADERIGEMLQATATSQGLFNYYYNKFVIACQKITFLEGQREGIQREFDLTKKKLNETEQRLQEANADRRKLKDWGDSLVRRIESIYKQLGLLRRMTSPESIEGEEYMVYNPELQEGFDANST